MKFHTCHRHIRRDRKKMSYKETDLGSLKRALIVVNFLSPSY